MAGIYPIPTLRSSELLAQSRLVNQLVYDQRELLRLQSQIATGRRLTVGSDDSAAATRGMAIQRLLELKTQAKVNLNTSQSYLDATDTAISGVSNLLLQVRATAMGAIGATATDADRQLAAESVAQTIQQMLSIGNKEFRGRHLFGGSRSTIPPYEEVGNLVRYAGNDRNLRSYWDIDLLSATNAPGSDVFGAFSPQVLGSVDLNPIVTPQTRLADLHGGSGVTLGKIAVSDGTNTSIIDLTGAETVADVADLIQANPPLGRTVVARTTPVGLQIEIDPVPGTSLTIREVSGGRTAADLGILNEFSAGAGPIVGSDLNPRLTLTTSLADVLGVRATALLRSGGQNNDLILEALNRGTAANGVSIRLVDSTLLQAGPGVAAGSETVNYSNVPVAAQAALSFTGFNNNLILTATTPGSAFNDVQIQVVSAGSIGNSAQVSYDSIGRVLTIGVDVGGATQVQTVINRIALEGTFSAAYDGSLPADGGFVPTATIPSSSIGVVTGSTGNSGGDARTIFINIAPGGTTANDVVAALQADPLVSAEFTARLDERDTSSPAFIGTGLVDAVAAVTSGGSAEEFDGTSGLQIRSGGETYMIDLSAAVTIEDLLNAINGAGASALAEINGAGTGLNLRSLLAGTNFGVGENGGLTATQLGLRSLTEQTLLADLNFGEGVRGHDGDDFLIRRSDGSTLAIDVAGAATLGDVIDLINNHSLNQTPGSQVTARLAAFGNGLELVEANPVVGGSLQVEEIFGSHAARDLGLVPLGPTSRLSDGPTTVGSSQVLTGRDVNPLEVSGVFNSLIRLHDALLANDLPEISRSIGLLDLDYEQINFARGEVGFRGQALEALASRLEDEDVQLQSALSQELDTNMAQAISELTARQAALEATLRMTANLHQLTLFNFL
jgi:flagellar hook-associated protein 3 FlgL